MILFIYYWYGATTTTIIIYIVRNKSSPISLRTYTTKPCKLPYSLGQRFFNRVKMYVRDVTCYRKPPVRCTIILSKIYLRLMCPVWFYHLDFRLILQSSCDNFIFKMLFGMRLEKKSQGDTNLIEIGSSRSYCTVWTNRVFFL